MNEKIKLAWSNYPDVIINIIEITNKNEIPKWQDCKKNEIYIVIMRKKMGDIVTVIRHKIAGQYDFNCKFEELSEDELKLIGVYPNGNYYCKECKEFSTRINIDEKCQDCRNKNKNKNKKGEI